MNERINELVKLANRQYSQKYYPKEFLENFATLIVRECSVVARNTNLEDVEGGDSAVLREAAKQIQKHFGVE